MKVPLYSKILLWLMLYLLILGGGLVLFFRVQFHFGLDSLIAGRAGDRIQSVASAIVFELEERPRYEWDQVLRRFSAAYHLQFSLFDPEGGQIAGEGVQLPPEVRTRLARHPNHLHTPESAPAPNEPPGKIGPLGPREANGRSLLHTSNPGRYWVIVRMPLNFHGSRALRPMPVALVAQSSTLSAGGLFFEATPWLAVSGGTLLFSMLFWFPIIGSMTRAISKISAATGRISEGRFDVRVPLGRNDELGALAHSVNRMGERLEGFVSGQKRFLGDIAHELCSPLARMQVALAILEERSEEGPHPFMADIREDVQEMANLVEELLSFSKASMGLAQIKLQSVSLWEIAQKAASREGGSATVEIEIPQQLRVLADPGLLQRCLSNLVRNSCRYAGHAGPITLSASSQASQVRLVIEDCGPGIPTEAIGKIFDPFYRPDLSRDRDTGGFGLGLAIVKTCVESCGGTVSCENRDTAGLRVEILLNIAAQPPSN